jgi:hypothetical protein
MTKKKPPTANPPEAFAKAFENIGGVAALAKWARSSSHNRASFYALFSKLFPVEMKSESEVKATVTVTDETRMRAELTNSMQRLIESHRAEDAERAASVGIVMLEGERYRDALERSLLAGKIIDHPPQSPNHGKAVVIDNDTIDNGPQPQQQAPATAVNPPPTEEPQPVAPSPKVVSLRQPPLFPGLAAGQALSDDHLTTTEKFYLYSSREKPP